ncbi:unnamed protein product [Rotaria sp. Silwood1]|nr:unnamed protein product [Rotaria sp. Silwood1]
MSVFEATNLSILEIRLENGIYLLHVLLPYHKIFYIYENKTYYNTNSSRSYILKYLMFVYTIASFLYVFAYCSLQTAICHVENVIVQNMQNVSIGLFELKISIKKYLYFGSLCQECGKPLYDLLTKAHQKFENFLHPKTLPIKQIFIHFFDKRRPLMGTLRQLSEPQVTKNIFLFDERME